MKFKKEDYVARISNASPLQLVVINYELVIQNCHEAKECHEGGDMEGFFKHIQRAKGLLRLLMNSLDITYEVSKELMPIYIYLNGLLAKAYFGKRYEPSCDVCDMMGTLLESWRTLSKTEKEAPPVMENVQQIFSGLTYKNGQLEEYVVEEINRGFKA